MVMLEGNAGVPAGASAAKQCDSNENVVACATAKLEVPKDFAYTISYSDDNASVSTSVRLSDAETYRVSIDRDASYKGEQIKKFGGIHLFTVSDINDPMLYVAVWNHGDGGFMVDVNGENRFYIKQDGSFHLGNSADEACDPDLVEELIDSLSKVANVLDVISNNAKRFDAFEREFGNVRASEIEKKCGKFFKGGEVLALREALNKLVSNSDKLTQVLPPPPPPPPICMDGSFIMIGDNVPAPDFEANLRLPNEELVKFNYIKDKRSALIDTFSFTYLTGPNEGREVRFAFTDCPTYPGAPQISRVRLMVDGRILNDKNEEKAAARELVSVINQISSISLKEAYLRGTGREVTAEQGAKDLEILAERRVIEYLKNDREMLKYLYFEVHGGER